MLFTRNKVGEELGVVVFARLYKFIFIVVRRAFQNRPEEATLGVVVLYVLEESLELLRVRDVPVEKPNRESIC